LCTGDVAGSAGDHRDEDAALLLMVVVRAFSAGSISFIKLIGVATLVSLLVDATIVRSILVPATMRLLGEANWWAPAAPGVRPGQVSATGVAPGWGG
jgi:uncharacterized membrane protein YdfJ with MMPL/SSD domain